MDGTPQRTIPLEGCFNFRDLGGYTGRDGRRLRWRQLFRADGLHRLTAADLAQVGDLGVRTVIDLRTEGEVANRGRIDPDHPVAYYNLPLLDVLPPEGEMASWALPTYVGEHYLSMLGSTATIRRSLELLSDPASYPALFHCMAGKDRTGVLSALVLQLVGVSEDDIVADYVLSGPASERWLAWMRATQPQTVAQFGEDLPALLKAQPASMTIFLDLLRDRHGSADGYAASIGLDGVGERLTEILLEPSPPA